MVLRRPCFLGVKYLVDCVVSGERGSGCNLAYLLGRRACIHRRFLGGGQIPIWIEVPRNFEKVRGSPAAACSISGYACLNDF